MGFTKLVLGVLLVGLGVLLLGGRLGFLPGDGWGWLFRYWPIVLIAIGLALLANAVKNPFLGWVATVVMIGALAFGAWWTYHRDVHPVPETTKTFDLNRPRAETLTLRARTFGGTMSVASRIEASAARARSPQAGKSARTPRLLEVDVRGAGVGPESVARFTSSAGAAILDWPADQDRVIRAPLGGQVQVRVPEGVRLRLEAKTLFSDVRADLSRLRPERVDLNVKASHARIAAGDSGRPSSIRIRGMLSTVELLLPKHASVRLEFHSPLTFRSLPEDFMENVGGRSRMKVWTSVGTGPPVVVKVEGSLLSLRVRREPISAL